jgi:hypothetical protein
LIRKLFEDCQEATHISILKENGQKISLKQKLQFHIHVFFCRCCQGFLKHSKKLDDILKKKKFDLEQNPPFQLSEKVKEEIKKIIKSS